MKKLMALLLWPIFAAPTVAEGTSARGPCSDFATIVSIDQGEKIIRAEAPYVKAILDAGVRINTVKGKRRAPERFELVGSNGQVLAYINMQRLEFRRPPKVPEYKISTMGVGSGQPHSLLIPLFEELGRHKFVYHYQVDAEAYKEGGNVDPTPASTYARSAGMVVASEPREEIDFRQRASGTGFDTQLYVTFASRATAEKSGMRYEEVGAVGARLRSTPR